tara:strand:- start:156 stop:293 length:138 start_codon:yes stop_codon:yes gene_type:complete
MEDKMTIETIEKYLKKKGIKYVRNYVIPERELKNVEKTKQTKKKK